MVVDVKVVLVDNWVVNVDVVFPEVDVIVVPDAGGTSRKLLVGNRVGSLMRAYASPLATTCHQAKFLKVFGSTFVLGSTKNCDRDPLAREREPTAAKDHFMLLTGVFE